VKKAWLGLDVEFTGKPGNGINTTRNNEQINEQDNNAVDKLNEINNFLDRTPIINFSLLQSASMNARAHFRMYKSEAKLVKSIFSLNSV